MFVVFSVDFMDILDVWSRPWLEPCAWCWKIQRCTTSRRRKLRGAGMGFHMDWESMGSYFSKGTWRRLNMAKLRFLISMIRWSGRNYLVGHDSKYSGFHFLYNTLHGAIWLKPRSAAWPWMGRWVGPKIDENRAPVNLICIVRPSSNHHMLYPSIYYDLLQDGVSETWGVHGFSLPIGSMYGIYANIWGILMVNVTIYGIHGSYGLGLKFPGRMTIHHPSARNQAIKVVEELRKVTPLLQFLGQKKRLGFWDRRSLASRGMDLWDQETGGERSVYRGMGFYHGFYHPNISKQLIPTPLDPGSESREPCLATLWWLSRGTLSCTSWPWTTMDLRRVTHHPLLNWRMTWSLLPWWVAGPQGGILGVWALSWLGSNQEWSTRASQWCSESTTFDHQYLVGGLEHFFHIFPYIGSNHHN